MKKNVWFFFTLALTLCVCGGAFAADYTWTGAGTVGRWTDTSNWNPSTGYPKGGDKATFPVSVAKTVTIAEDFDLGGGQLTLTNDVGQALTFDCVISGAGSIHKGGGGELHLKKANTFSGGFTQLGIYPCDWKSAAPYPAGYSSRVDTYIYDGKSFGTGKVVLDNDGKSHGSRLVVKASMTIPNDVQLSADGSSNGNVWYDGGANQEVHWTGHVSSPMRYWCSTGSASGRKVYFDGQAIFPGWTSWNTTIEHFFNGHAELSTSGTLSPGAGCKFHFNTSGNLCQVLSCTCNFYLGAENALDNGDNAFTLNFSKNGWFHLDGHDQAYGNLAAMTIPSGVTGGYGYESPSDQPAVLALIAKVAKALTFSGEFAGGAGLWYAPTTLGSTFTISKQVQPTTGTMRVGGEGNVLAFVTDAGFSNLGRLQVDVGGTLRLAYDAKNSFANEIVIAKDATGQRGRLEIGYGRSISCKSCRLGEESDAKTLAPGVYDKNSPDCAGWLTGDGKLLVVTMNAWKGDPGARWEDYWNWTEGHVPTNGEPIQVLGSAPALTSATERLSRIVIGSGATLRFASWNACLSADTIVLEGTMTCPGSFTTAVDKPQYRVWLKCADLTIAAGAAIDVNTNGWAGGTASHAEGYGPGRSYNRTEKSGASHGGYGSIPLVFQNSFGRLYDDPLAPTLPGSGAVYGQSSPYNNGTAGGGAVLIEATGTVTVDGSILACGGDAVRTYVDNFSYCGSGGSIWIKCAKLTGRGGEIRADGGSGVIAYNPAHWFHLYQLKDVLATNAVTSAKKVCTGAASCGGGGMIRIEYSVAQYTTTLSDMTISAAGGVHSGRVLKDGSVVGALTAANEDLYRTEADLGTLSFTDRRLVDQMLGKGLSGCLVGVSDYTWEGDLEWTRGHVRFPGTEETGVTVAVNGNLSVSGPDSRLEIGGYMTRTNAGVSVDRYAGTHLNQLQVAGDLKLLDGAALDIRAAATNATMTWGGLVTVSNNLVVGNGSYLYPWCDIKNLGAPHFEVGGDFLVESNATVMADRRGGMGGRGGSSQTAWFKSAEGESGWGLGGGKRGAGGSHGGLGGVGYGVDTSYPTNNLTNGEPGPLPDSEWWASYPGSGGGNSGYGEGGEGGGLVHVQALGRIAVDGKITANGWSTTYVTLGNQPALTLYNVMGGGSGGGIYLAGAAVEGSGFLSAKGGPGISGTLAGSGAFKGHTLGYSGAGGGGGRIVLAAGTNLKSSPYARWQQVSNLVESVSISSRVRFDGTADVSAGGVIWGSATATGEAPTFEGLSLGEPGTVRYKRFFTPGFLFSIEYPDPF